MYSRNSWSDVDEAAAIVSSSAAGWGRKGAGVPVGDATGADGLTYFVSRSITSPRRRALFAITSVSGPCVGSGFLEVLETSTTAPDAEASRSAESRNAIR